MGFNQKTQPKECKPCDEAQLPCEEVQLPQLSDLSFLRLFLLSRNS